jgi:two-component system response regulator VanR
MRVLLVEDEPYLADAIRDGLRLEAITADIAGDGDLALELLTVNDYDIAVLDRDIPGPSGDEVAKRIVASGSGTPILMLTAADRLDDKATGFGLARPAAGPPQAAGARARGLAARPLFAGRCTGTAATWH